MTAEIFGSRERITGTTSSLPDKLPAELIGSSPSAMQVYKDFMWHYVGHPALRERQKRQFPRVSEYAADGTVLDYDQPLFSGYMDLGHLVHVRLDPNQNPNMPDRRFLVVTADLLGGDIEQRTIIAAEHDSDRRTSALTTTLYLDDDECRRKRAPLKYWPHVKMSNNGFYYSPGRGMIEEKLSEIEQLDRQINGLASVKTRRIGGGALSSVVVKQKS